MRYLPKPIPKPTRDVIEVALEDLEELNEWDIKTEPNTPTALASITTESGPE